MILNCPIPVPWATQFPDDYVPELAGLILNSWQTFKLPAALHENPITQAFCTHLRNNKKRDNHFFRIELESTEIDELGNELGRIDLKFIGYGSCDEHVYFSIECKRLHVMFPNGKVANLAPQYAEEGMYRYFNGQYAAGLNKGGMLGYVMDGNVETAMVDVDKAIKCRCKMLCMKPDTGLERSKLTEDKRVRETHHQRTDKSAFIIHHVFLPLPP
jgi:hypothetical protein